MAVAKNAPLKGSPARQPFFGSSLWPVPALLAALTLIAFTPFAPLPASPFDALIFCLPISFLAYGLLKPKAKVRRWSQFELLCMAFLAGSVLGWLFQLEVMSTGGL